MTRRKQQAERYLGLDLSLRGPGFADIAVKDRKPALIRSAHFKTTTGETRVQSYEAIESFAYLFVREQTKSGSAPYIGIIREAWPPARNYENNDKVHGAWSAVDRALERFGQRVTDHLSPSTVKRLVTGSGKAEKEDVADAVRKLLGLSPDYVFASDDESDACAVALAWLIQKGVIDT
ncbi:hypothetical protein B7C51_00130 [Paenibacillus larvae subsp. pulvifaciens]|uniref:Uncharacterized protein n=1 Tax=Paenibacillus larvae subsp. pulvifaciens TaxID=1477 RepID=A0A1V0UMR2_9BACL|nr:hypothetical protein B7C51_00130 [Paenibacillus larvae subsp. pulvifaciens]